MYAIQLKAVKKGQYFTKKPLPYPKESQVFVRGDYDKSSKKYSCTKFSDFCADQFIKGNTIVYTDFIF